MVFGIKSPSAIQAGRDERTERLRQQQQEIIAQGLQQFGFAGQQILPGTQPPESIGGGPPQVTGQGQDQASALAGLIQQAPGFARDLFGQQQPIQPSSPSPKDFTPESLERFTQTQNFSDLVPVVDELAAERVRLSQQRLNLQNMLAGRVPAQDRRALVEQDILLGTLQDIQNGFKDGYVGFVSDSLGDAALAYERRLGDNFGFVQWWQDYNQFRQDVIRGDAGANLTEIELAQFRKFTIQPGDSPAVARNNLRRQNQLVQRGISKATNALRLQGFDVPPPPAEQTPDIGAMSNAELLQLLQ